MSTRQPNEDLFEDSRMSFGEHLDELRQVLVRALIGVAIACIAGFIVAHHVVNYLTIPLTNATAKFRIANARSKLIAENGFVSPELNYWFIEKGLVPRRVFVDPASIINMIKSVSPSSLAEFDFDPQGFQASNFDPDKISDLCTFWIKQKDQPGIEGEQPAELWELLNSQEKTAIQSMAEDSFEGNQPAEVTKIFNRLATNSLYKMKGFAPLASEPEWSFWHYLMPPDPNPLTDIVESLKRESDPDLEKRLNRVLLTGLFIDYMPAVRLNLYPIEIWESAEIKPQSLSATEPFLIWVKAGVITGLVIASPWVLFQLWMFVASGMYPAERNYVYIFLPISLMLFFSGAALAFFFVFEPVLTFLFTFNAQMGIDPQLRINDWLSFVLFLPLGFGIGFQLPLVMLFLNRINVFSIQAYLNKWRIAVMVIFVLSMILTPADPISMILLAFPLTILYFLGILLCYLLPSAKNPFGDIEPDNVAPVS